MHPLYLIKMKEYRITYQDIDGYPHKAYVEATNPEGAKKAVLSEYHDIVKILYIDQVG